MKTCLFLGYKNKKTKLISAIVLRDGKSFNGVIKDQL